VYSANIIKKILICLVLAAFLPLAIVIEARSSLPKRLDSFSDETVVLDDTLFSSNQFTQADDLTVVDNFLDIPTTFSLVGETDTLLLYMETDSFAIRVVNKEDGFIYGSSIMSKDDDLQYFGSTWEGIVNSAVTIKYYSYGESTGVYTTVEESMFTSPDTTTSYSLITNGFSVDITYGRSGIGLELRVYLEGDQLKVEVPRDKISEGDTYKLRSIKIYPFLGAVYSNSVPGYIFVPDGSGALIRYQPIDVNTEIYEFVYYGLDLGIRAESPGEAQLLLPVSGMVHGIDQHGFITMIDDGEMFASFIVNPAKNNLKYYYSHNEFQYRSLYQTPTSESQASSGSGRLVIQEDLNSCNVKMTYQFLAGAEANYVGMAGIYRDYLIDQGYLIENLSDTNSVPLYLEIIGAEKKPGFIFDETMVMTDVASAESMIDELTTYVDNMTVVMKGFFAGGFSSSGLINKKYLSNLGSSEEFKDMIQKYQTELVELYFYIDVMKIYTDANYSLYNDISQKINNNLLMLAGLTKYYYYVSPSRVASAFSDNVDSLGKLGIDALALGTIGNKFYSDYNDKANDLDRKEVVSLYRSALAAYTGDLLLYRPNLYLLPYAKKYLMTPMTSSNFRIYTDTVPFMAELFHGTIEAFAPFANFIANQRLALLKMIDYGLYPSYILTNESAYKLQDTELRQIYSSSYGIWKDKIQTDYQFLNNALSVVYDASITSREVITTGVYKNSYSNGVILYVNYTNQSYVDSRNVISPNNYLVVMPDV